MDAIAYAMQQVLSTPILALTRHQKGLERAKEFSWERTARETMAVYEQVLAGD